MKLSNRKPLIALSGIILCYCIVVLLLIFLIKSGIVGLPFGKINTVFDAWFAVIKYLPVFGMSLLMVLWLVYARLPVFNVFFWQRFSALFFVGLIVSGYYTVDILFFKKTSLNGLPFWFPLLTLCILNAFSEELLFRHIIMSLLGNIVNNRLIVNGLQSLFYALPHLMYGSLTFAFYAYCYGFLLGLIKENNGGSLLPCLICHFIIDLGAIGAPVL